MTDFAKYEALGNDYLVVDPALTDLRVTGPVARELCDRRRGVGADGVLYGPFRGGDRLEVRIFNSDGSVCAKSGNGLRMFARYLREQGYVGEDRFTIDTAAGPVEAEIVDLATGVVTVAMGSFSHDSTLVPAAGPARTLLTERLVVDGVALAVTGVQNGNPHCVVTGVEVSAELARRLGPLLAGHELFPERANVHFLEVRDRANLAIEVWERGAGYTLASGSGACAAAAAAHTLGLAAADVTVHMPGGEAGVRISTAGDVWLTGAATPVHTGALSPPLRARLAA